MARPIDGDALKRWCEKIIDQACHPATVQIGEVFLEKVRSMPTLTLPNEPLTLEELREMDGEPVYMTFPSDTGNQCGHWALVGTQRWGAVSLIYGCGWSSYESAVETLGAKFYRRPPEGEEHCYG